MPARPGRHRLLSGSCASARSFAPRFLSTLGRPHAVALRFARCDQLTVGLAPIRVRPCWAHRRKGPPAGGPLGSGGFACRCVGLVDLRLANDDLSAVEREIIELHVEAPTVVVDPGSAYRLPETALTVLGDGVNPYKADFRLLTGRTSASPAEPPIVFDCERQIGDKGSLNGPSRSDLICRSPGRSPCWSAHGKSRLLHRLVEAEETR